MEKSNNLDFWYESLPTICVEKPELLAPTATPSVVEFATKVYPFLEVQPFHENYYRLLQLFAEGRIRKLMVSMPPQHGKSVGASTLLPAYMLGWNPDSRIAIASYSATLANKFNRRVQRIIEGDE